MSIHPTAIIDPKSEIGSDVNIGPFCVIESDVVIENGCTLASGVVIKSGVHLGPNCTVGEHTVFGALGQHVSPTSPPGRIRIGANNTFREACTVHRSLKEDGFTVIGDNNFLMVGAHVAHDCQVGDNNILANNCLLGGHVVVDHRCFISGGVAIHQFCSIGAYAMVGGQAHITRDVPPFVTVDGLTSRVVGINRVGLRRSGFSSAQISRLKDAYSVIYRSGLLWKDILEKLQEFNQDEEGLLYDMLSKTKRGIIPARIQPVLKFKAGLDNNPGEDGKENTNSNPDSEDSSETDPQI